MKHIILTIIVLFSFMLLNAYTISGHTNLLDSPIEGAYLELYNQSPNMGMIPLANTYSAADGSYSFDITETGWYYLSATIETPIFQILFYENALDPNMATPIHISNMSPNQTDIDFNFQSSIQGGDNTISGNITSTTGTSILSARVELFPMQYSSPWMDTFVTFSNDEGSYSLEDLPDGEYMMWIRHQSYFPYIYNGAPGWFQADIIVLENGVSQQIDIEMLSTTFYSIEGYVEDAETGLPIVQAKVFGFSQNGNFPHGGGGPGGGMMPSETFAYSDINGFYSLILPQDDYLIMAQDTTTNSVEFYEESATPIDATWITLDQHYNNIDFTLNDNLGGDYSVSGTLTMDGYDPENPIPMLAVAVSSDEDWEEAVSADSNGGYIIPDLPDGSYYIYGFSPISVPTYFEDAINYEDAVLVDLQSIITGIDIELKIAEENGYLGCNGVVLNDMGEPVENATVAFVDAFGNIHDYAYTDPNGEYEAPSLNSLNYNAIATKTFYESDVVQLPIFGN